MINNPVDKVVIVNSCCLVFTIYEPKNKKIRQLASKPILQIVKNRIKLRIKWRIFKACLCVYAFGRDVNKSHDMFQMSVEISLR